MLFHKKYVMTLWLVPIMPFVELVARSPVSWWVCTWCVIPAPSAPAIRPNGIWCMIPQSWLLPCVYGIVGSVIAWIAYQIHHTFTCTSDRGLKTTLVGWLFFCLWYRLHRLNTIKVFPPLTHSAYLGGISFFPPPPHLFRHYLLAYWN